MPRKERGNYLVLLYIQEVFPYHTDCRTDAQRMWVRLTREDPALLEHFEGFLSDVVEELQQVHAERDKLESHVRR